MNICEYPFPEAPADSGYCVFPDTLENDELVLFHASPAINFDSITKCGFKAADSTGVNGLSSVSFAKRSVSALTHAMTKRQTVPGKYHIFMVRYASLNHKGVTVNICDIHDRVLDPAPVIIGYCVVPTSYNHI